MKKYILPLIMALTCLLPSVSNAQSAVPGQWRIHNTSAYYFQEIVGSPNRMYILALGQIKSDFGAYASVTGQLFMLDRKTNDLIGYNAGNYLHGNVIRDIAYNAGRKYLLIIYEDYSMDLLFDDDSVYSIPGLASATMSSSKNVNSIVFDAPNNKAYLATDFGYIVIDDKKCVISESRIYNEKLNSIARVGDKLVMGKADGLYTSPLAGRHTSLADFTKVADVTTEVKYVLPLTDNTFATVHSPKGIYKGVFDAQDGELSLEQISTENPVYYAESNDGYFLRRANCGFSLTKDGVITSYYTDKTGYGDSEFGTWDMKDFYFPIPNVGIQQIVFADRNNWTIDKLFKPHDATQAWAPFSIVYSQPHGMVASMANFNRIYNVEWMNFGIHASSYKDGEWKHHSRTLLGPTEISNYVRETGNASIDPLMQDYMWVGTRRHGLIRIDLRDNTIEVFAHPSHANVAREDVHPVFPTSTSWAEMCLVAAPDFDADGNMWAVWNPANAAQGLTPLYCWKKADRLAGNVSAFKGVQLDGYIPYYLNMTILACKTQQSRNILAFANTNWYYAPLYLFDHNGTIDDTSDDKLYSYSKFMDQDGTTFSYTFFNTLYEDPATGYIWVGTDSGLFYFDPVQAIKNGNSGGVLHVRRVKVARNDGTNLADYLLNGYDVWDIASDGAGRKWFATNGGGVFVSSADGSQLLDQFTTANSDLPSDQTYSLGFDATSNAVWIGGSKQISTYYCDATKAEDDFSDVLAFPNPVRPEYHGPVTIKGLMADSLVKIVDASGAIVRELGRSNGGMAVWDLTDLNGRQVGAGVYYVMSSTTSESVPSKGNSTKILVVR